MNWANDVHHITYPSSSASFYLTCFPGRLWSVFNVSISLWVWFFTFFILRIRYRSKILFSFSAWHFYVRGIGKLWLIVFVSSSKIGRVYKVLISRKMGMQMKKKKICIFIAWYFETNFLRELTFIKARWKSMLFIFIHLNMCG